MSKEIYISSTPHETRLAIVENDNLAEIYYERENEYTLAGSIYNGKVTRVLPGMQSSFVDIGLERDAFLYITDFMEEAGDSADFEGNANAGDHPRRSESSRSESSRSESSRSESSRSEGRPESSREGSRDESRRSESRSDSPREGRRDGRDSRGHRSDRNDRDAQPRVPAEPTDADLFNAAVAGVEPIRSEGNRSESSRDDREGRNRRGGRGGRGRGDGRSVNSDSTPRASRDEPRNNGNRAEPDGNRADTPTFAEAPSPILSAPAESTGDLGEGAPGADGSRRWRGRRGRRGNRGGSVSAEPTQNADFAQNTAASDFNRTPAFYPDAELAQAPSTAPEAADDTPIYESYTEAELGPEIEEDSRLDGPAVAPPDAATEDNRGNREPRSGRGDRNRNRNDRGGRDFRDAKPERRIPRGFAPSTSLYKVEGADDTHAAPAYGQEAEHEAPAAPVILPGESLRKYRPASETEPETPSAAVSATPAPSSFVAQGWDGGMVLPGETLRPRGPVVDSSSETRAPRNDRNDRNNRGGRNDRNDRDGRHSRGGDRNSRDSRGGGDNRGARDTREARGPRSDANDTRNFRAPRLEAGDSQAAKFQTGQSSTSNPEFSSPDAHDVQHEGAQPGFHAETTYDRTSSIEPSTVGEPASTESAEPATVPSDPEAVPTYLSDPDHAPASHLITPIHSTFIAPPPMPESVAAEPSEPAEYEPTEAFASFRVDPAAPSEFRHASPVLEVEAPEAAHAEPLESAAFAESEALASQPVKSEFQSAMNDSANPGDLHSVSPALAHALESTPEAHEMTAIGDTGNMHSEPPVPAEDTLHTRQEADPASPISHETAVVDEAAQPASLPAPHFAFGDGAFEEEEMLDDEEDVEPGTPLPLMHAHSAEDFEQETLENAADLGTMLREMSIDHITRTEPAIEEDDEDLSDEEDFLEEDQDFNSASLSSDDDEEEDENGAETHYESDEGTEEDGPRVAKPFERAETENAEYGSGFEGDRPSQPASASTSSDQQAREPRRDRNDRGRRDGRREGRDRNDRSRRDSRDGRDSRRSSSSEGGFSSPGADRIVTDRPVGDRDRSSQRRDTRGGRNSAQVTNLPAISDLLKPGQELLCQIAKEPIAKKGARITSHIALPGRFLVFMPTVSHTGVSRKIESDGERRRLKEILLSEKGEASGGFIVRTAAAGATEEELRSDLRFLLNLWADIKTRSESSKSPALIYHDLNLVERVLRDQVTDTFSAIWVDTEAQYEQVLRFLQRFQPSLIRRVKLYTKETPLFEQFGITEEINKALRSKVWLKSGGSIVINQTEALVAIDINTGKFVGKTARLEDTIVKTNLDAIPEIVRQIRLRDLGGIIIIDFIDMDERKNRNKVMAALEEELKSDRAPSKVLQFNDFGLVAITRKRVKQSLERTLSTTCGVCAGTGMTKSAVTVCNDIYVEMRKMHKHLDRGDVMLRVHPEVVKQLKAPATNWLHEMEEMCGKTILIKSDPSLHPEQFDIH